MTPPLPRRRTGETPRRSPPPIDARRVFFLPSAVLLLSCRGDPAQPEPSHGRRSPRSWERERGQCKQTYLVRIRRRAHPTNGANRPTPAASQPATHFAISLGPSEVSPTCRCSGPNATESWVMRRPAAAAAATATAPQSRNLRAAGREAPCSVRVIFSPRLAAPPPPLSIL